MAEDKLYFLMNKERIKLDSLLLWTNKKVLLLNFWKETAAYYSLIFPK